MKLRLSEKPPPLGGGVVTDDAMRIWVEHHPDQPRAVRLGTFAHQLRAALTPDLAYMMLAVAIEKLAHE